jgi:hypothetical protein
MQKLLNLFLDRIRREKYYILGIIAVLGWCYPYFISAHRIEWGDFSFFVQGYEAIKIHLTEYHQFPWFNPWVAGGVPLYANPQFGVFSLQTLLVIMFGAPFGLKLALVIYTLAGYTSMYALLVRYFKVVKWLAVLLGLIWICNTFFVAHLPAHFTFAWYMLAPLFLHLSLVVKDVKSGIWLGLAFSVMGLSQLHNAFFHIAFVCTIIIAARLIYNKKNRLNILYGSAAAASVFIILVGHRALFTIQNVLDFPREIADTAPLITKSILGIVLPYSVAHPIAFITYPSVPFGWTEITANVGIFIMICFGLSVLFLIYTLLKGNLIEGLRKNSNRTSLIVLLSGLVSFVIGLGAFSKYAPYALIKHLPVIGDMRVSSRWFIWLVLAALIFIAISYMRSTRNSFFRFIITTLVILGVCEMFIINVGYQQNILIHNTITAPLATRNYTFIQANTFGDTLKLPRQQIPREDNDLPHFYREYEATTFNIGVINANDALVDNNTQETPRCAWIRKCNFVITNNAEVTYWSPEKIVLKRTGSGKIELNMNNSNYFLINGKRDNSLRVAEPRKHFIIDEPTSKYITLQVAPSAGSAVKKIL